MEMTNREIAEANFEIFKNFKSYEKFIVHSDGRVEIDQRWIPSLRRRITGDSRSDLIGPVENTIEYAIDHRFTNVTETIEHLEETLKTTYPDFSAMTKLLQRLKKLEIDREYAEKNKETGRTLNNLIYLKSFQQNNTK